MPAEYRAIAPRAGTARNNCSAIKLLMLGYTCYADEHLCGATST
jgi:hypothetical protein